MKNTNLAILKKTLLALAPVLIGLLTFAVQYKREKVAVQAQGQVDLADEKIEYDPVLLKKFKLLVEKVSPLQQYYCIGTINAKDHADTTGSLVNVPFEICKDGTKYYYKLGDVETIKRSGISLTVDNRYKKILITSGAGDLQNTPAGLSDLSKLSQGFQQEYYQLKRSLSGNIETLSLINPRHITCKEYSISIDTLTGMPSRFYTRLTNLDDPLRTDNEKIVDIRIKKWDSAKLIDEYTNIESRLTKEKDGWIATGKFESYEVLIGN